MPEPCEARQHQHRGSGASSLYSKKPPGLPAALKAINAFLRLISAYLLSAVSGSVPNPLESLLFVFFLLQSLGLPVSQ